MTKPEPLVLTARPRHRARLLGFTGALGVTAACTIVVVVNLFAARFDHRWDLTTDGRYTPSAPLRETLGRLKSDVTAVVLLGRGDPLAPSIGELLESYRNVSPKLGIDWVDPDRDPARYLSKQSELGIREGRTEDGLVTTDALVVLTSGDRKYYLTPEEVTGLDPEHSDGGSSFEHAFAVGLLSLFRAQKPEVCFTLGHRELSVTDESPEGLAHFRKRLEHDALSTRTVDLATQGAEALAACRVIVVAAPDVPLSKLATDALARAAQDHSSLLLLGGLIPNAQGRLESVGFEPLGKLGGIEMTPRLVVELDERFRLPELFGGTFFATPAEHAVNRGLLRTSADSPLRVVVALAQSLTASAGGPAKPLLTSSLKSIALSDIGAEAIARAEQPEDTTALPRTSFSVAMAGEFSPASTRHRRIVVGPVNLVQNRTFDNPALVVTQSFTDSVVSWLAAEPGQAVEVVARTPRPLGLELSAQELSDTVRYVLFVMPMSVLLSALGVYWLRRKDGRPPRAKDD